MIRDRDYMRDPPGGSGRPLTVTLIITLIALFFVQCCCMFYGRLPLLDWFGLSLHGIREGRVWQLLTFQFMHSAPWPWHVLLNCVGLYFLGRSVEEVLGKKRFFILYLTCGFAGGVLQLLLTWVLPHHEDVPVVGASAGIMGLLAMYATMFPMREITIFVLFFPVTLRVQYLFWFALGISIFGSIIPFDDTAHAAHLGGLLTGLAYMHWGAHTSRIWLLLNPFRRKSSREKMIWAATIPTLKTRRSEQPAETNDLPSGEFISQEVDPILDKISAHGIQSLTDRERQILQAARAKMSGR